MWVNIANLPILATLDPDLVVRMVEPARWRCRPTRCRASRARAHLDFPLHSVRFRCRMHVTLHLVSTAAPVSFARSTTTRAPVHRDSVVPSARLLITALCILVRTAPNANRWPIRIAAHVLRDLRVLPVPRTSTSVDEALASTEAVSTLPDPTSKFLKLIHSLLLVFSFSFFYWVLKLLA